MCVHIDMYTGVHIYRICAYIHIYMCIQRVQGGEDA